MQNYGLIPMFRITIRLLIDTDFLVDVIHSAFCVKETNKILLINE